MSFLRNETEGVESRSDVVQITTRVPREVHDAMKVLAAATGMTSNEVVMRALRNYLATEGHREAVRAFANQVTEQYVVALDKLADL